MLETSGLNVHQHINNIKLPIGKDYILCVAQYSADTFCEMAVFSRETGKAIALKGMPAYQHYVSAVSLHYFIGIAVNALGHSLAHEEVAKIE